jgi:hypothetical protein
LVPQLACVDDRHVSTVDGAIEASDGTAGASNSAPPALPAISLGTAGAGASTGAAGNSEALPPARLLNPAGDAGAIAAPSAEAPPDAGSAAVAPPDTTPVPEPPAAPCDTSQPFQSPLLVSGLSSAGNEYGLWLTPDELTAYFASDRGDLGGPGDYDLYRASRASIAEPFAAPSLVPLVNTEFSERKAVLSPDGLQLFFSSDRPGLGTGEDIYVALRASTAFEFGEPGLLTGINSAQGDLVHSITKDGRFLYFDRPATGAARNIFQFDLSTAATRPVTEIESRYDDAHALESADGLTIYWATTRVSLDDSDGSAQSNIWSARRASPTDPLGSLAPVAELNTASAETVHYLSADGCRIYIGSERSGRGQLYVAARP